MTRVAYGSFSIRYIDKTKIGMASLTSINHLYILGENIGKKAGNENSKSPAKPREPGKVRAGAGAGIEWARELQAEKDDLSRLCRKGNR